MCRTTVRAAIGREHATPRAPHDLVRVRRRPGFDGEVRDAEGRSVLRDRDARGMGPVRITGGYLGHGLRWPVLAGPRRCADQRP